MAKHSALGLLAHGLTGHRGWPALWRHQAEPAPRYDVLIVGGGGHGLATAYYLARHKGQGLGVAPLGIKALMVLRIEKGYLHVGSDTDATTTPDDVGMGVPARRKPMITIGRRGLDAPEMLREDRPQFVGLKTRDGIVLEVGSHILPHGFSRPPAPSEGHVGSSVYSPALGAGVALAMLRGGRARHGETVGVWSAGRYVPAVVGPTCFLDPAGQRLRDV